ncbi:hypothetical protein GW860_13880 [bacterium]|nr:hypothetical protein [bacterium]
MEVEGNYISFHGSREMNAAEPTAVKVHHARQDKYPKNAPIKTLSAETKTG